MSHFSGLNLRKISTNTLAQFIVRIIGSTATLTTTLLITYFLGLDSVGNFTKVVAFVSIFYIFIDFGFNSVLLRNYFKTVEHQLGNLIALRLIISLLLLPIIFFASYFLPYDHIQGTGFSEVEKGAIIIYSLTLIALSINNTLQAFFQKKLFYSYLLIPSLVSNVILITIVLYATFIENFYLLFTSYIFSGVTLSCLSYFKIKNKFRLKLQIQTFSEFSKTMLYSSWPLGCMLVFNFLYSRADIFLLTFLKPSSDVGIYGVSYRFFEIALALPTFLANSTYPLLLKLTDKKKKYLETFLRYLKLYVTLSTFVVIAIVLLAPLIGFLGSQFTPSIFPLQILAISLPFFFLTSLLQWHFLIKKKLSFLLPLYATVFVINVFLNIVFIPKYSYVASATITGLSEGLVFLIMLWYFQKSRFA